MSNKKKMPRVCQYCKSLNLFSYRLDNDWEICGDLTMINDESYYKKSDMNKDSSDRLNFIITQCHDCNKNLDVE